MRKKYGYLLFFLFSGQIMLGQQASSEILDNDVLNTFSKSEYQQDLGQLFTILTDKHPQPFEFISSDSLNALLKEQEAAITDATTIGEFEWMCRFLTSSIACCHTGVYREKYSLFIPEKYRLPIKVAYLGSKLYVIDPLENSDKISVGTEIMSINNVDVKTLKRKISRHISADGHNKSAKAYYLNRFLETYIYYSLGCPPPYSATVMINNRLEKIDLTGGTHAEKSKENTAGNTNILQLEIKKEENTAIITIPSFYYINEEFDTYKSFIDSCFLEIGSKQLKNVVIDLRNNGGGDPYCASYLLQYFADQPFVYFHPDTEGYADLRQPVFPISSPFTGKPYILINGGCLSTTGHLCSLIKKYRFGTFVGKETGATFTCNDNSQTYSLDHTGLIVKVATKTYKTAVDGMPKDKGIIPDYEVTPGLHDLINRTDPVMDYTMKLIKRGRK